MPSAADLVTEVLEELDRFEHLVECSVKYGELLQFEREGLQASDELIAAGPCMEEPDAAVAEVRQIGSKLAAHQTVRVAKLTQPLRHIRSLDGNWTVEDIAGLDRDLSVECRDLRPVLIAEGGRGSNSGAFAVVNKPVRMGVPDEEVAEWLAPAGTELDAYLETLF